MFENINKPLNYIQVDLLLRIIKLARIHPVLMNSNVRFFYVLLTVHLGIFILAINQLDAQSFCFTISLFHASTSFKHHVLIIRRSKLYYTDSGIITLYRRLSREQVHLRTGRPPTECHDTRGCIIQF